MGQIIEFPDDKKWRERIKELKKDLESLVFERDNLVFVVCENIKTEYLLIFGSIEYRIYKTYCTYLRLKRKKDMIQAKKNRQDKIKIEEIEDKLDEEFADYKKKLDEKIGEINEALSRAKSEVLSEEETKVLKKLYKNIVKRLHPDLNPSVTDVEKELFYNATESYKNGDLPSLQIIYDIVCSGDDIKDEDLDGRSLADEVKRLEGLVGQIQEDINFIKSTPPYTWSTYLEDEEIKSERLSSLEEDLKSFEEAVLTQEEAIKDLMRDET